MSNTLLERFKKLYEEGTSLKVSKSKVDKYGNLTVWISNVSGKTLYHLNVKEYQNGEIYWY